jgi:hypothetical protein
VLALRRIGKRIAIGLEDDLWLLIHLMIAGRLHWKKPGADLRGKGDLSAFDFPDGSLSENPENGSNGDQPSKPVKAILKVEKNRDGKTGKTNLYFDYPRSRILTNEEYMDEFGGVMKI